MIKTEILNKKNCQKKFDSKIIGQKLLDCKIIMSL